MTYRILAYHTVGHYDGLLPSGIGLSPAAFVAHLDWLVRSRNRVVPLDAMLATLAAGREPAADEVALTFDDGYADTLRHAAPALASRGLPATVFVSAGLLGRAMPLGSTSLPMLSPDELRELARIPGIAIGSHGLTHCSLAGLPADQLRAEVTASRATLEDLTGAPVHWLSYPFGAYDAAAIAATRTAGYADALSVWTRTEGPFARLRIPIHTRDGRVRLAFKLSRAYFPVKRWLRW